MVSGLGLDAQERAIRTEVERRGWALMDVLSDPAVSGKVQPSARPGFAQVLDLLECKDAVAVVVAKLDRLSRSVAHLAAMADHFTRRDWGLVACDQPNLDTTSASGRLMFNMLGAVSEWERLVIGERTTAALAAKKARGDRLGRPVSLPDNTRVRIAAERERGRTLRSIADELTADAIPTARGGRWYPSTVAAVLRSVALDAEAAATSIRRDAPGGLGVRRHDARRHH